MSSSNLHWPATSNRRWEDCTCRWTLRFSKAATTAADPRLPCPCVEGDQHGLRLEAGHSSIGCVSATEEQELHKLASSSFYMSQSSAIIFYCAVLTKCNSAISFWSSLPFQHPFFSSSAPSTFIPKTEPQAWSNVTVAIAANQEVNWQVVR